MTKEGKYYIQKFTSSGARTFYHHNRQTMDNNSTAKMSPGPGSYQMRSDFGFYESKHAKKFSRTQTSFGKRRASQGSNKSGRNTARGERKKEEL